MKNDKPGFFETLAGLGALAALVPLALVMSAAARAMSIAHGQGDPFRSPHGTGRCPCHTPSWATPEARAKRRADTLAKREAHEERKRLRREAVGEPELTDEGLSRVRPLNEGLLLARKNAAVAARQVRAARAELRRIRELYDAERTCAWLADIEADPYRRREAVWSIGEERLKSFGAKYAEKRAAALAAAPPGLHAATPEAAIAMVGLARAQARDAELRYAIACAAAGAVPS